MTTEAQRIAIAEACGWKQVRDGIFVGPDKTPHSHLPNFLYDLNAMHEAEKVLQSQCRYWPDYICELGEMFRFHDLKSDTARENISQAIHATAAQRAEAFLRTVGKWEETPSCGDNAPKSQSSARATRREEGV